MGESSMGGSVLGRINRSASRISRRQGPHCPQSPVGQDWVERLVAIISLPPVRGLGPMRPLSSQRSRVTGSSSPSS